LTRENFQERMAELEEGALGGLDIVVEQLDRERWYSRRHRLQEIRVRRLVCGDQRVLRTAAVASGAVGMSCVVYPVFDKTNHPNPANCLVAL